MDIYIYWYHMGSYWKETPWSQVAIKNDISMVFMGLKNQQTWLGGYHLKLLFFIPWLTTLGWLLLLEDRNRNSAKLYGLIVPDNKNTLNLACGWENPFEKHVSGDHHPKIYLKIDQCLKPLNQPESVISKQIFIPHFLTICCLFGENAEHDSPLSPTKTKDHYPGSWRRRQHTPGASDGCGFHQRFAPSFLPIAAFCFETH